MPRYFFHIRDHGGVALDEEGGEFPDLAAARVEARASARDVLAARPKTQTSDNGQRVEMTDESGRVLETLLVTSALN